MVKKGLKCPKCGSVMTKSTKGNLIDPFEVKYRCEKCESTYIFQNWKEYYEACEWEEKEKGKEKGKEKEKERPKQFNPSMRGSVTSEG